MADDPATAHDGRSPWPAVAAIGGLLAGVAAVAGLVLDRDESPSGPPSTSSDLNAGPASPTSDSSPDPDDGDGTENASPVPDDTVGSQGAAVVPVGDVLDLDDDGSPDLAWDGTTVTWIDSRIAAAPPGPTAERCREVLSSVPVGSDWVSTVGAVTPPEEDCIETSGGAVAFAEVAYDNRSGGLAVTWTAWG